MSEIDRESIRRSLCHTATQRGVDAPRAAPSCFAFALDLEWPEILLPTRVRCARTPSKTREDCQVSERVESKSRHRLQREGRQQRHASSYLEIRRGAVKMARGPRSRNGTCTIAARLRPTSRTPRQ